MLEAGSGSNQSILFRVCNLKILIRPRSPKARPAGLGAAAPDWALLTAALHQYCAGSQRHSAHRQQR